MQPLLGVMAAAHFDGRQNSAQSPFVYAGLDEPAYPVRDPIWPSTVSASHADAIQPQAHAHGNPWQPSPGGFSASAPAVTPEALAALLHTSGSSPGVTPELLTALLHTHSGMQEVHVSAVTPGVLVSLLHGHSSPPAGTYSHTSSMQPLDTLIHQHQHGQYHHHQRQQQQQQQHEERQAASQGQALTAILQQEQHQLHQQQQHQRRQQQQQQQYLPSAPTLLAGGPSHPEHTDQPLSGTRTAQELALALHQNLPGPGACSGPPGPSPASSCLSDLLNPLPSPQSSGMGSRIPAHYPEAAGPRSAELHLSWQDTGLAGFATSALSLQPQHSHSSVMSHMQAG